MSDESINQIIDLLDVELAAFAMCEIENGCSLLCEPADVIIVHYVLRGEGSISWDGGSVDLRPGIVAVIPPLFTKQINGSGLVLKTVPAEAACPMATGIVRFRACATGEADLVLGCASIEARVRGGVDLFANVREPFAEHCAGQETADSFNAILRELSRPGLGTRGIVGAIMKQILILLLRAQFERLGTESPIGVSMQHPRLARALLLILEHPQRAHTLDSLAAAAGMSRSRFVHHFRTAYGRTPMEFVQLARLQAAAQMLRNSRMPIKAISSLVGFASRSHFSHAFRTQFGSDPTSFRVQARELSSASAADCAPFTMAAARLKTG